jgi:hypothetical protein
MKYLLADVLVYNDEDGSFSLIGAPEEEPQMLTGTANAIMKLLVAHHGNVIEREGFLRDVWDERGLQAQIIRSTSTSASCAKCWQALSRYRVHRHRAQNGVYAECRYSGHPLRSAETQSLPVKTAPLALRTAVLQLR